MKFIVQRVKKSQVEVEGKNSWKNRKRFYGFYRNNT